MTLLGCQRELFAIPREVAYFNCASLAPLMRRATEAGRRALERRAEPWRIAEADWFNEVERRRSLFAGLLNISPENVALTPSTSYGLAVAARNLSIGLGKRVLIIAEDYPSNVYTWRAFCKSRGCELFTIHPEPEQDWTSAILAAVDERTAMAAVPSVHWTDGSVIDLPIVARRLRAAGAKLVVDASQSLGAAPFDFAAVQPDFLVSVGYKWLLGPFGLGYLYVADDHLDGAPLEENWISRQGSSDFASLTKYADEYSSGARRFDVGQRTHFETTPVANAALEQITEWGIAAVSATLAKKTEAVEREVKALGFSPSARGVRAPHMLGLQLPADGLRSAAGLLAKERVFVGARGTKLRVSPHVYNDSHDIDQLIGALARAAQ